MGYLAERYDKHDCSSSMQNLSQKPGVNEELAQEANAEN